MSNPKVCVLMSTYNGEKYIKEQIESILSQENVDVNMLVRDDSSADNTVEILRYYSEIYDNLSYNVGDNIGVGNSFMELLYSAPDDYDYYAFADQDDIWDKDKLIIAVKTLLASGKALYTSNQECVDKNGKSLGMRFKEDETVHTTSLAVLQDNMLAGCTFVFNNMLKRKICIEKHRPSRLLLKQRIHDVWVINVAALTNDVVYDSESHMKYRQHANNVVGANSRTPMYNFKLKIKKIISNSVKFHNRR